MTAAGMSMHMAMINARAASNQNSADIPEEGAIRLTEKEIREIRRESGKEDIQISEDKFLTEKEVGDPNNDLPKCSHCCQIM